MKVKTTVKPGEYYDSITLMQAARRLSDLPGLTDAAVVMGTEANKSILREAGLLTPESSAATPNDLIIAVNAGDEKAAAEALSRVEALLQTPQGTSGGESAFRPKSVRGAVKAFPQANAAVISVAGRYAAAEAWQTLRHGLHTLLFSDNVSLADEIALKTYARDHGLLLMGPGAGTTILNGVALGFANVLPSGPVGIVSAAGTGLQEVSTLLARQGVGVSQALGMGGRDLSEAVGGLMMLSAFEALQADEATQVIVLISKPPSAGVAQKVLAQVTQSDKPTVVCFLGGDPEPIAEAGAIPALTLEEAAFLAAQQTGLDLADVDDAIERETGDLALQAQEIRDGLGENQRCLRGLFSGGTLCYEAQVIWQEMLTAPVYSNAPLVKANLLADATHSREHTAVDLGEEEFTVGRLHPMIDNELRLRRLWQEARDPQVAVIVLDVVLGYGAHPDPASELAPVAQQAIALARSAGRLLTVVASVTGTEADPQNFERQVEALQLAGVMVCPSNAAAARLAGLIVQ